MAILFEQEGLPKGGPTGTRYQGKPAIPVDAYCTSTGALSYSWVVLHAPRDSRIALGGLGTSNPITFTPDLAGAYRLQVTVNYISSPAETFTADFIVKVPKSTGWNTDNTTNEYVGPNTKLVATNPRTGKIDNSLLDAGSGGITELAGEVLAGPGSGTQIATVAKISGQTVPNTSPTGAGDYIASDGSGGLVWAPAVGTGGITELEDDVVAGPGAGLQSATVVALQGQPVSPTAPSSNQVLTWNGSAWTPAATGASPPNGTASGDLSGTYPAPTVAKIQNRSVAATAPSANQVLAWVGSAWTPTTLTDNGITQLTSDVTAGPGSGSQAASVVAIRGQAVAATAPTTGQRLTWNGSAWEAASPGGPPTGTASGDLSGTYPSPTVAKLQGQAVSATAPTTGQVLSWNGSAWTPTAAGGPPSGSAGGDLSGTYPNPSIAKLQGKTVSASTPSTGQALIWSGSAWTPTTPTDNGITQLTSDVTAGPGNGSQAATVVAVQGKAVSATAPTTGQVLAWSGSAWTPTAPNSPPNGAAGGDLSGTYPNPTVAKLQGKAVSATAPTTNQILVWNGSAWTPTTPTDNGITQLTGDVTAGPGNGSQASSVVKIQGRTVASTAPTTGQVLAWNGSQWEPTAAGGPPSGSASGDLSGTYPGPTVAKIQGRGVAATAPTTGQVLAWNGSSWTPTAPDSPPNGSAGGDLSGTYPSPTVAKIQGKAVSATAPSTNQVLTWSGTEWAPAAVGSGPPSGTASGDLSGTYPSPTVAKLQGKSISATAPTTGQALIWNGSAWTPTTPTDNGITQLTSDVTAGPGNGSQAATVVKIQGRTVNNTAPTTGQVLAWNGSAWTPTAPDSPPNGSASGDLSGTYPSPTVAKIQGRTVNNTAPTTNQVLTWNGSAWEPANTAVTGITELTTDVLAGPGTGTLAATVNGLKGKKLGSGTAAPDDRNILAYDGLVDEWEATDWIQVREGYSGSPGVRFGSKGIHLYSPYSSIFRIYGDEWGSELEVDVEECRIDGNYADSWSLGQSNRFALVNTYDNQAVNLWVDYVYLGAYNSYATKSYVKTHTVAAGTSYLWVDTLTLPAYPTRISMRVVIGDTYGNRMYSEIETLASGSGALSGKTTTWGGPYLTQVGHANSPGKWSIDLLASGSSVYVDFNSSANLPYAAKVSITYHIQSAR